MMVGALTRERGGIGIRSGLKIRRRKACGFESHRSYHADMATARIGSPTRAVFACSRTSDTRSHKLLAMRRVARARLEESLSALGRIQDDAVQDVRLADGEPVHADGVHDRLHDNQARHDDGRAARV